MLIARKSLENPIRAELFGIERLPEGSRTLIRVSWVWFSPGFVISRS